MRIVIGILAVLGALFLGLVVFLGAGFVFGVRQSDALLVDAEAYVEETIRVYGAEWDPAVVNARASDELRAELAAAPGALETVSAQFAETFGPLTRLDAVDCADYFLTQSTGGALRFAAQCSAHGRTERASLHFNVNVEKGAEAWALNGFYIDGVIDADPAEAGPRLVAYEAPAGALAPEPAPARAEETARALPAIGVSLSDRALTLSTPHAPTRFIGAGVAQAAAK